MPENRIINTSKRRDVYDTGNSDIDSRCSDSDSKLFLTDGQKENTENSVMDESRENLEKKLDEYCNSLVEKKKNELKKQGEAVKSDMKRALMRSGSHRKRAC